MALPDAELVQRTLAGDREAFGLLVERHRRAVYALALQRGFQPGEAEDVAQEVFLKAFRGLRALKDGQAFERWVYGIAAHVNADAARDRRRRRREETGLEATAELAAPLDDRVTPGLREDAAEVVRALQGLNEDQRVVVTLRYLHGLNPKQIAERLGEPRGTIRSRLHHALAYLKTAFGCAPGTGRPASAHARPHADEDQKEGAL